MALQFDAHAEECGYCGYRLTLIEGGWLAEDDTLACAGRGAAGEVLPHTPRWVEHNGQRWYFEAEATR